MNGYTLYHHPLSVCSMKARLALVEKGLAWNDHAVDIVQAQEQLEPWYIRLNPKGVVPTLVHHQGESEQVVNDSAVIIRYVAEQQEGISILPVDDEKRALMERLIKLADEIDLQILSYAKHPSMEKSEQVLQARIRKSEELAGANPELSEQYAVAAERSRRNSKFRVDPAHVGQIEAAAQAALSFAGEQLARHDYLAGDDYSLADVIWTVVLSRLELLGYGDWIAEAQAPELADYYSRMQARESFTSAQIQNRWWKQ